MATIDRLDIQIEGSAQKANVAINDLIKNLDRLANSLKIDTSGLEKIGKSFNFSSIDKATKNMQSQTQKVSKSLSQITEQYKDLGKGFEIKGSTQQIQKQIDSLTNKLANAKLAKDDFEVSGKTNLGGYETAVKNVIKYTNQIESLKNQLAGLQTAQPKLDFNTTGIEEAGQKVSEVTEKIKTATIPQSAFNYNADAMRAVFGEAAAGIENWSQATQKFGANAGAVLNQTTSKTDELKARTEQFEQSLKNLQIPPINTDNINALQRELEKSEANFEKLRVKIANGIAMGRISANVDDKGFRNLREQMALAEKKGEALREKIKQVQQASTQTSTGAKKLGDSVNSASKSFSNLASSSAKAIKPLNNLGNSFKSLLRTILPILGIRQLFNWGKQAIEVFSDLTEVQNVVDTTFGDMAYKVEEFAETSIEKFGMSELALKQISSRFQAMGTAMGFPVGKMSDMSIELTKLTADMASFYNVEQKAVAEDLESIFTGTTRPMRQYGIDLTQATLQEWALKQGLDADMRAMSQAEKTMLRYQYVLANTTAAHGDFERTMYTWANQTRILSMNFQQLAGIVGGALVNAFKPVVIAVNKAMGAINAFAKTISNALGQIFGWTYEEGGGGLAQDFGEAADAAGDIAGSTGKAAKNIDKMKAGLRAFDELKVINMPGDDGGSGGGGGGAGGTGATAGDALGGKWVPGESILKKYESELDTLYKLGDYIGKKLTEAMDSIDWKSVYEKARNFGKGLADFLNGLISPDLFGAVGRTIAGALNTAVYAALSFGETFDWKDFGMSIAAGVNNFFATYDFASLAETLNTWAKGILDTTINAIDNTDWGAIGEKIGTFLAEIDFLEIGKKIGGALWEAINAGIELFKSSFKKAPIETTILGAVLSIGLFGLAVGEISGVITSLSTFLAPLVTLFSNLGSTLSTTVIPSITELSAPVLGVAAAISALVVGLGYVFATNDEVRESFSQAVSTIREGLQPALDFITNTLLPDLNAGWDRLLEILAPLGEFLNNMFVSVWQDMINPTLTYIGETVLPKVTEAFEYLWNNVLVPLGSFLGDVLEPVIKIVSDVLTILWENVVVPLADAIGNVLGKAFEGLCDVFNKTVVPVVKIVIEVFQFLWDNVLSPIIDFLWTVLKPVFEQVFNSIGGIVEGIGGVFGGLIDFITGIFARDWEKAWSGIKDIFAGIWNTMKNFVKMPINAILGFINGLINGVVGGINSMARALNRVSINVPSWVPGIGGATFGFNIPTITAPQIPYLAKGAVFKGGNPFLAVVNDQKRGQTNVETPLKVIQEALREELSKFSVNVRATLPSARLVNYGLQPTPVPSYARAYGDYHHDTRAYAQGEFNGRNSGLLGMSETQIYNMIYNATESAINNSKLMNDQKDMVEGILKKPTMEIGDIHDRLVQDSYYKGANSRGGKMSRLAVAYELYE